MDASVVVSALIDTTEVGRWARGVVRAHRLAAPHHLQAEVLSALRRHVRLGEVREPRARSALDDLQALPIDLYVFEPFMERIWALRHTLTPYDAWYVALAETLDAPLATLDARLARAPGIRCEVELAPSG